jgi:hypothetical protein
MIEYEELCAALERYVARTAGGSSPRATAAQPSLARPPQITASPLRGASAPLDPPTKEVAMPPLSHHDEPHDPDFGALQHGEDATHVGGRPQEEEHNEIDIHDVLSDDEL